MWDRSVLLKTEVSFGGTEVSFGFCEKTEVSYFTIFWDKCLFPYIFYHKKSNGYIFKQHFRENHAKNNDK